MRLLRFNYCQSEWSYIPARTVTSKWGRARLSLSRDGVGPHHLSSCKLLFAAKHSVGVLVWECKCVCVHVSVRVSVFSRASAAARDSKAKGISLLHDTVWEWIEWMSLTKFHFILLQRGNGGKQQEAIGVIQPKDKHTETSRHKIRNHLGKMFFHPARESPKGVCLNLEQNRGKK